jgi:cytochrome c oxidase assembly protein subunit 15
VAATRLRRRSAWLLALVAVTIVSGAFVAGIDGGFAWNTFPLMGGALVPPGYGALSPWYLNMFENVAAVQFHHRILGMTAALMAVLLWTSVRRLPIEPFARRALNALPILALAQMAIGIATLLLHVPVLAGVLHQLGAVLVLTDTLLLSAALQTNNGRHHLPAAALQG